jgi:hypothetical protein
MYGRFRVLPLAALALLGGCGGEMSKSATEAGPAEAASVANAYFGALREGDGAAACALLTEVGQQAAVKVFVGQGDPNFPDVESLDAAGCPGAVADASLGAANFPSIKPSDVTVAADGSTAEVQRPDGNALGFAASDSGWLLENPIPSGR